MCALLRDDATATYDALARTLGVSRSSIRRDLRALEEAGLIVRRGSDKSGYWEVLGE
ncbi:MAG: helix-turn-helix domain-containing protein [Coriobacteriales bacterium]|nr:helix-turn-helix domain-containing protein [Coriobacteriales bacterium]